MPWNATHLFVTIKSPQTALIAVKKYFTDYVLFTLAIMAKKCTLKNLTKLSIDLCMFFGDTKL